MNGFNSHGWNSLAEAYADVGGGSGHKVAFFMSPMADTYDYDPADDGPECEIITRILSSHTLYDPGQEVKVLRAEQHLNELARQMFGDRYGRLGRKRQAEVRRQYVYIYSKMEGMQ